MKVLTSEQMRQVEEMCAEVGLTKDTLMENAGRAVAEEIKKIVASVEGENILVLVGPGNNGGDGLVAARYLHDWGAKVSVYLCAQRQPDDLNYKLVQQRGMNCIEAADDANLPRFNEALTAASIVVDAIFGTGKVRPFRGILVEVLDEINKVKGRNSSLRIFAVDLPSGLNADTGYVDLACLYADYTLTLGFPKQGLFGFPGAERAGKVKVVDIGIPYNLANQVNTELMTDEWARHVLPERPLEANKGTFGRVLVIAGSLNYVGAAYLACSGAMRVGAGLVTLATATSLHPILAAKLTEVIYLPLPESRRGIISPEGAKLVLQQAKNYDVMLLGCGLGQNQSVAGFLRALLLRSRLSLPHLVLDADALNILSGLPGWWKQLTEEAILTPHPGEMAKLTGAPVEKVQSERLDFARGTATDGNKIVVLKGAYTVIASPSGLVRICPVANPGLASAGTGDVLAGAIAGLVAQGLSLFDAASLGTYLHGKASEEVRARLGDAGMIASDLLPALPPVIKQLKEGQ